ncbi:MAG: peroxiredoxin [Sphingomonadales bacterium]|nr:peroxiredoxin [Sphingomonadales bacterium]
MTISLGDKVPEGILMKMGAEGPQPLPTSELFSGKTVALVSVPGAFTPTCSARHLPGYVEKAGELAAKGIDTIACMAVNDVFVMHAWGKDQGTGDAILMLGDGNGDYAKALGLEMDATGFGMGLRGQRFSMVVTDGVVTQLNIEDPGAFHVSSVEHMLNSL